VHDQGRSAASLDAAFAFAIGIGLNIAFVAIEARIGLQGSAAARQ